MRRVKCRPPNGRYVGLVLLFSCENGEPLAIMPDGMLQRLRVGATNGLAMKYLARRDATAVGILGSGWQAGAQLMAACAVREIETIRCFSPNPERCAAFSARDASFWASRSSRSAGRKTPLKCCRYRDVRHQLDRQHILRALDTGPACMSAPSRCRRSRSPPSGAPTGSLSIPTTQNRCMSPQGSRGAGDRGPQGWGLGEGIDFQSTPTLAEMIAGACCGPPLRTARSRASSTIWDWAPSSRPPVRRLPQGEGGRPWPRTAHRLVYPGRASLMRMSIICRCRSRERSRRAHPPRRYGR